MARALVAATIMASLAPPATHAGTTVASWYEGRPAPPKLPPA